MRRNLGLSALILVPLVMALATGCGGAASAVTPAASFTPGAVGAPIAVPTLTTTPTLASTATPTATSTLTPSPTADSTETSRQTGLTRDAALPTHVPLIGPITPSRLFTAPAPTAPAFPSGPRVITLADSGKIIPFNVGDEFLLSLGPGATWIPGPLDLAVVRPIPGTPGLYQTVAPGRVVISIDIEPPCRNLHPPCMLPTRLFVVTIDVS